MFRLVASILLSAASLGVCAPTYAAQGQADTEEKEVARLVTEEISASYPRLNGIAFKIRGLNSDSIYLETRFTLASFFLAPHLHYEIRLNPELTSRHVPPEGLRSILAHELAHGDYFHQHHRLALLGLVRLAFPSYRARFERRADLEAIGLGYGPGLRVFRIWLYQNVPPGKVGGKKRDYFSPDEIDAIERALGERPTILSTLSRCVPLNLVQVEREVNDPAHACPAVSH